MQPDPRARAGWQRPPEPPVTFWWFLVPLLTCGLGTAPMVLAGAIKLRSRTHLILSGVYFVAFFANCAGSAVTGDGSESTVAVLLSMVSLVLWVVGTFHVGFLQQRVRAEFFQRNPQPRTQPPAYGRARPRPRLTHYPPPRPDWNPAPAVDPALARAQWRAARREEARRVQTEQPSIASELMIGRPDLPGREYDDGGLVDVNHVPAEWLARALRIERPLADRIVEARDLHNGFTSPDELLIYCDGLTPEKLAQFRDRLVFMPR
ncbi:ComEA family DNA-binding protein [Actinoplanes flavus]|uniref:Helix-hairpin-helix domain-containing protein n=1 Tax=Actinoplanes flavus TaxID=2820290 RepID=A0ABS3UW60_9ACTN|nr:helix-hairpin-helix domain-containing protein [Actinoplanes flavus]MBO3742816.1 helix-hairpin-helix domain-containing protein [Actinoplanes flavus]